MSKDLNGISVGVAGGTMIVDGKPELGVCLITGAPIRRPAAIYSITEVRDPHTEATIKIWRAAKEIPEYVENEILLVFTKIPGGATMAEMIDIISSISGVTRIELTDRNGCGCCVQF